MKIAILTSGILPVPAFEGGAVENLIDAYLDYNERMGLHDITVFSVKPESGQRPKESKYVRYKYVDVTSLVARIRRRLRAQLMPQGYYNYFINYFYHRCRRELLREDWDVIILENRPGYAIDLRPRTRAKLVLHLHYDSLNPNSYLAKEICRSLDCVAGVSDYICSRVQAIKQPVYTQTVYNGYDIQQFMNASPARREDFGLKADDFVLIFTGRVAPIKGIKELVEAMKQLRHLNNLKLLVVGNGFYGNTENGDHDFYKQLRKDSEALKDHIIFTGFRPYAEIPSILKMADLAVVPSTCQEALGSTAIEAMAAGVPLLATRSGGIPEVSSGVARLVELGSGLSDCLRMNIEDLYFNAADRRHMAELGIKRSQRFAKEQYAARFISLLEQL